MKVKRMTCMVLACMLFIGTIAVPASAAEVKTTSLENIAVIPLATNTFSVSIPAKTTALTNSSFSLAAGETVTIKAFYTPFSASVDFGLVAPNGTFYYFNVTNGNIDKTIQVNESGSYTLQVRNNANYEVEVSGYVNY